MLHLPERRLSRAEECRALARGSTPLAPASITIVHLGWPSASTGEVDADAVIYAFLHRRR